MKKKIKWWQYAIATLLLTGCASAVHIEKDDKADFSRYKTFAWAKEDGDKPAELAEQKIKAAVNAELARSAGWKEVKNRPDILLSYDVLVERGVKTSSNPVYSRPYTRLLYNPSTGRYTTLYYPSQFMGYERDERPIKEGTITISMVDTKADKMVWQGWTTDEVDGRRLTSREIENSVRSIFKKFDVANN